MKKHSPYLFYFLLLAQFCKAQLSISTDAPNTISFGGTITGVGYGSFTAGGFTMIPTSGKLNSNAWAITGFSDGNLAFSGTKTTGDYARGTTTMMNPVTDVGATIGGIYSYTGVPFSLSDPAMLIQSTDVDFTPGTITLRIKNTHASNHIYVLDVSYDLWVRNNTSTSNGFNFSYSTDDISYTNVAALDYSTTATADASGIVNTGVHYVSINTIDIDPGAYGYLRWSVVDISGSGERDEFYLNSITVNAPQLLPVGLVNFDVQALNATVELSWQTQTELNNNYFSIERSSTDNPVFKELGTIDAAGNSAQLLSYLFIDNNPEAGINYYRLKQIDFDGNYSYSDVKAVQFGANENSISDFLIYPNPATSTILLSNFKNSITDGAIFYLSSVDGRNVPFKLNANHFDFYPYNSYSFNISELPSGLYHLTIVSGENLMTADFVKK